MSNPSLVLGPVVFREFELPPDIRFGGKHRIVIHRLAGGQRVIDCLGRDEPDIIFSGVLSGPDASLRARILDQLRTSGTLLPLTWDVFFYTVVVHEFAALYQSPSWIPYRLSCTVLRDEADGPLPPVAAAGELLLQGVTSAAEYGETIGVDLSAVLAAITVPGATEYGTSAYYGGQDSIDGAQEMLASRITSAEAIASQLEFHDCSTAVALASLTTGTETAAELAALVQARGFLGGAITEFLSGAAGT